MGVAGCGAFPSTGIVGRGVIIIFGIWMDGFMGTILTGTKLFTGTKAGAAAEGFWLVTLVCPWKDSALTFHFYPLSA